MPRKPASENVVCLCRLLIFLLTFQTYFCIQANSMDPDQTASCCSQKRLLKSQAGDKADTIVVIGSLRIKKIDNF